MSGSKEQDAHPLSQPAASTLPGAAPADALAAGAGAFGRYELLEALGAGGMASVYRARVRGPGGATRTVALKLILPHLSREAGFVRLFLEEMRVALALCHRNIVQTFDAGEEDGVFYLAMELVRGCSLRGLMQRLNAEPLPVDIALFIGMELCNGLRYAHTFRPEFTGQPGAVIHRDVSPSNVLLSTDGDVKLTDFGIARATDWLRQTASDLVMGKLAYMAPEQARGKASIASDLFSVGAVLYELLTGRPLRQGLDLAEVLQGPDQVLPPSATRPDLPLGLEQLILRSLSPDPSRRPSNAEAFREALGAELFQLQVKSGKPTDAHGRLAAFLQALAPLSAPPESSANRLAEALLAEARGVKTAVGHARVGAAGMTLPQRPSRRPGLPAAEQGPDAGLSPETEPSTLPLVNPLAEERPPPVQLSGTSTRLLLERPRWQVWLGAATLLLGAALISYLLVRPAARQRPPGSQGGPPAGAIQAAAGALNGPAAKSSVPAAAASASPDAAAVPRAVLPPPAAIAPAEQQLPTVVPPASPAPAARRAQRRGRLAVNSVPWARVYVDGTYRGDTPLQDLELTAGTHELRLENPRRQLSRSLKVRIRAGELTREVVELE